LSRSCTVCSHPDSVLINEELVLKRTANRRVAAQYGLTEQSIRRHREHIPEMLARSSLAEEVAEADSLLERLEDLHRRTEAILARVEETDNYGASLGAIREMRRNLELIGEVTKELDRTPTINLHLNPQYIAVRTAIVQAVESYPEVREAISQAMLQLEEGGNGLG
jgi:hypothetical protein